MGERLLDAWASSRRASRLDGPALLVFNPDAPEPATDTGAFSASRFVLKLEEGEGTRPIEWEGRTIAKTKSDTLPLQSESLDLVVLSHVIARGDEALLAEACRMLRPGGSLLVLGLNRQGWRFHRQDRAAALPGIHALAVRERLEELDMNWKAMHAAGFLGGDRPRRLDRGLAQILMPVADLQLIVARPAEPRVMNPIAESRMRAVGAPSALAGH